LADRVDAVIGVDTHRDTHEVEIADANGTPIATCSISNDSSGFAGLIVWIAEHAPGPRVIVSVEGTRSYGIGLARALTAAGIAVIECEQPNRKDRRGRGKSDPIDAHLAVLTALRSDADRLPTARADGDRDAARRALTDATLAGLCRRRLPNGASRAAAVRHAEIRRLAVSLRDADLQLRDNRNQLLAIVDDLTPGLTDQYGIGPVSAAQAVVSFSHPGRCRNEAAFAALAGTSPLPASSGRTIRHRLNRGGDRALNRAIHTIALTRIRSCPRTRAYVQRRTLEGKTPREIRRCLKRYIARELFRTLTNTMTSTTSAAAA